MWRDKGNGCFVDVGEYFMYGLREFVENMEIVVVREFTKV